MRCKEKAVSNDIGTAFL